MYPNLSFLINSAYNNVTLLRTSEGKAIFTNPATGNPYQVAAVALNEDEDAIASEIIALICVLDTQAGDVLRQTELASLLENITKFGAQYMYTG